MTYIGIDTGLHTGIAVWDGKEFTHLETTTIIKAMLMISSQYPKEDTVLYVEDARLRKWIPQERGIRERIGRAKGAGSVSRDAQIWEDFAEINGYRIVMVAPKDHRTKMSAEAFASLSGYKGRTSEHARDAATLVWGR